MKNAIHVWDLPIDKVYIKFNRDFSNFFFNKAHKNFKSWNALGNYLNIRRGDTLIARNWRNCLSSYPLSTILKLSKFINVSYDEIERNIVEIKSKSKLNKRGGSTGKSILNPKLPLKINKNFIEILGHIYGDGCIVNKNPHKGIALKYTNSEKELIKQFMLKISDVFGEIKPNIQIRNGEGYRRNNFLLQYPTIISLFIQSVHDFKSKDDKEIPSFIFKLNSEKKCVFLRALYDDEGTVSISDKSITIGVKPKKAINIIRKLLIEEGFNPGRIYPNGVIHKVKLSRKKDIFLFKQKIGFKHPEKNKKLNTIIKNGWKFERYLNGVVRSKINSFIIERNGATILDLREHLNRSAETVREHLKKMESEGKISRDRSTIPHLWSLR